MNNSLNRKINTVCLRQCVKDLLIQQFMLHHGKHLHFSVVPEGEPIRIQPRTYTPVDIYKCLHQGEFGVGHSIGDPDSFRERLWHELNGVQPDSKEPVLENVSLDNTVMRLNLRPYRSLFNGDVNRAYNLLAEVCLRSAAGTRGNAKRFLTVLNEFGELNKTGELIVGRVVYGFPPEMVDHLLLAVKDLAHRIGRIPVFSHSGIYRQFNSPSYRVVDLFTIQQSPLVSIIAGKTRDGFVNSK